MISEVAPLKNPIGKLPPACWQAAGRVARCNSFTQVFGSEASPASWEGVGSTPTPPHLLETPVIHRVVPCFGETCEAPGLPAHLAVIAETGPPSTGE